MVTQAAIQINNHIYTLPRPARHADIMEYYHIAADVKRTEGFLDSNNIFLDRYDAFAAAVESHQQLIDYWHDLYETKELYSENLW